MIYTIRMINEYMYADPKQTKDNDTWTVDTSGEKLGLSTSQIYYDCDILLLIYVLKRCKTQSKAKFVSKLGEISQ